MQKVSYMGNGVITEFYFNFPYFEHSNIVVTVNNGPAPTYNIIGTPGGTNADFPYICGKVVFDIAPSRYDCITISRQLPMSRIADYQPLEKIEPTTLNQDLNYLMEVIKDRKDELSDLTTKYGEIADKESTTALLAQISAIHDEIVAIDAKITELGDISTLRDDVTTNTNNIAVNTNNIATNTGNITTLDTRTNGMIDYVIESQAPTAENNYTWYRKYKSGWVEMGGRTGNFINTTASSSGNKTITLPIEMSDTKYHVSASRAIDLSYGNGSASGYANRIITVQALSTTQIEIQEWNNSISNGTSVYASWNISGFAK